MQPHFDLLVIGGGSGGIATAVQAAKLGARCALVETGYLGGTCVNVGCVPKKVMWNASHIADMMMTKAPEYGWRVPPGSFSWETLVKKRQDYIARLHHTYQQRLSQHQITLIQGMAQFQQADTIQVDNQTYTANHVVIATGSEPIVPDLPGVEHTITSDGFFALTQQPKHAVIVGGGYIGVELAGTLHALGSKVHLLLRHGLPLRRFDSMLGDKLVECMRLQGIQVICDHKASSFSKTNQGFIDVNCAGDDGIQHVDSVILAVGRRARTQHLNCAAAGIEVLDNGVIPTDAFENTNVPNIYAVGDVNGKPALTPVAIAAGRHLAKRLFGKQTDSYLDYTYIPTVVFSHPPIATIGLSETEARQQYDADQIKIYQTEFTPMLDALCQTKIPTVMKLITQGPQEQIIGCHIIGYGADEMLQGFAVAINMGATKTDFDNTLAIHPTSAEELVTLI